jgi:DNA-binding transcriptional LysR family regulator
MSLIRYDDVASMILFAKVVQLRSFTAAGREAGIAKSAVSKRVAQLEARLGVRLLSRTTRKLGLTEDGLRFYEHCAAMVAAADAAREAVEGAHERPRGKLRMNAPQAFARMHLVEPMARFLAAYPEVEIDLTTDDRLVDVVEGGYDLVVRVSRLTESSLVARKLATDRIVVCASPAYFAERGRPEAPADLVDHDCLHYALVPLEDEWRFGGRRGISVPVRSRFSSNDGDLLRRAAIEGAGIAVLPYFIAARDVAAGRLELVLEKSLRGEVGIHAVFSQRKQMPARARVFLQHLVKHFGASDWQTRGAAG